LILDLKAGLKTRLYDGRDATMYVDTDLHPPIKNQKSRIKNSRVTR
jgi:hypothetical protein